MLIGITGKKGSGKNTAANVLINEFNFSEYSFAEPIKKAISAMLGLSYHFLDSQDTKEITLEEFSTKDKLITPRLLMQTMGTDWARKMIHPDFWLILAKRRINKNNDLVITDVRFENEADLIRNNGGILIHVVRPCVSSLDTHESEYGVSFKVGDVEIINDSSIDQLHSAVRHVVDQYFYKLAISHTYGS